MDSELVHSNKANKKLNIEAFLIVYAACEWCDRGRFLLICGISFVLVGVLKCWLFGCWENLGKMELVWKLLFAGR